MTTSSNHNPAPGPAPLPPTAPSGSHRTGRWTEKEKELFRKGLAIYANASFRWKRIAEYVSTRSAVQCKTHHQKLVGAGVKTKRGGGGGGGSGSSSPGIGGARFEILLDATKAKGSGANRAGPTGGDAAEIGPEARRQVGPPGAADGAVAAAAVMSGVDAVPSLPGPDAQEEAAPSQGGGQMPQDAAAFAAAAAAGITLHAADGRDENGEPTDPLHGRWSEGERRLFSEAMAIYGKGRWKLVSKYVGTRTSTQCKTHHQKVAEKTDKKRSDSGGNHDNVGGPAGEGRVDGSGVDEQGNPNVFGKEEAIVARALVDYRNTGVPEPGAAQEDGPAFVDYRNMGVPEPGAVQEGGRAPLDFRNTGVPEPGAGQEDGPAFVDYRNTGVPEPGAGQEDGRAPLDYRNTGVPEPEVNQEDGPEMALEAAV